VVDKSFTLALRSSFDIYKSNMSYNNLAINIHKDSPHMNKKAPFYSIKLHKSNMVSKNYNHFQQPLQMEKP
jgi:hypothetical protein